MTQAMGSDAAVASMERVADLVRKAKEAVEQVIYGQGAVVEESLITLLAGEIGRAHV